MPAPGFRRDFMRQEGDFWDFFLADQLNKTPAEIRAMPARDFVGLCEWYRVKGVIADLAARTEASRTGG